jgi:hypothetical protein
MPELFKKLKTWVLDNEKARYFIKKQAIFRLFKPQTILGVKIYTKKPLFPKGGYRGNNTSNVLWLCVGAGFLAPRLIRSTTVQI